MRKALIFFLITIMITLIFNGLNYTHANEIYIKAPLSTGEKVIQKFVYTDLDNISKRINIVAKNAIELKKEPSKERIEESTKDIDVILSDINYLLTEIRREYEYYKEDLSVSNGLLAIGSITGNYRVALSQLKEYLLTETIEDEYRTLSSYFRAIGDAEQYLNTIKAYLPKL